MSDTLTLRQAFDKYLAPDVRLLSAATGAGYRLTLRNWEEIITANPAVTDIEDATVAAFRDALAARLAPATVNGRLRYVFAILNKLAPALPGNRRGVGVLERVPYCRSLKLERKFPRVASMEELSRLYHACDLATWPARLPFPPAEWWRTFLVTLYNTGPRRRDLESLRTDDVSFEHQTLRFAARKTGKLQVVPLNKVSLAHLQAIWSDRQLVFPVTSGHALFRQWKAIKRVAGITERLTFHDLRRTCGTAFANAAGIEVAATVLGHSVSGVTAQFYVDPRERVRTAAEGLKQPDAFLTIFDRRPELRDIARPKPKRRADWSFAPGEAVYRGHVIQLGQKPLAVLTMLVTAGGPVSSDALRKAVWYEKTVSSTTVKTTIAQLRRLLKIELRLPDDWDPIPNGQTGEGWTIQLPETEAE